MRATSYMYIHAHIHTQHKFMHTHIRTHTRHKCIARVRAHTHTEKKSESMCGYIDNIVNF